MTAPVSVFIVDDEYQSRQVIGKMLHHYFKSLQIVGEAGSVTEAVEGIGRLAPQIVFLDVHIGSEAGFDVLDRLDSTDFELIFTTAYQEYAVKAFRYSAIDYLLKPINATELETAVQRALTKIQLQQSDTTQQVQLLQQQLGPAHKFTGKIAVPTPDGLLFIAVQDIVYCQGQSNYTEIHLVNGQKLTSSHTLKLYDEMLTGLHFFRVHKSFLINLQHIKMYRRGEGGTAVMSNGREIEIARRNKTSFLNLFKG
ncbi:MAG TPA: LytTR family DNA-binding domain-containing protein [Chitinophagaceae bacterium]|jgi:two-component system LytT family response regulator